MMNMVVEQGRVRIPGWTWAFWFRIAVNRFSLSISFLKSVCHGSVNTLPPSFLLRIIILDFKNELNAN